MANTDPRPQSAEQALPQCARFIDEWNHKDTSRSTIDRLAKLLDDAGADIDNDDYLRARRHDATRAKALAPGAGNVQQMADHRGDERLTQPGEPVTKVSFLPSQVAYLLDPDKAQVAREALRAHRGARHG